MDTSHAKSGSRQKPTSHTVAIALAVFSPSPTRGHLREREERDNGHVRGPTRASRAYCASVCIQTPVDGLAAWCIEPPLPPLFVKESVAYTAYPDSDQQAKFAAHLIRRGEIPRFVTMPVFAREFTGARPVMLRRQCTGDYKLEPIYRFCRPLIGRRRGQRHNTPPFCEMRIGISAEENAA
jgi:hypothetical protein